jgi:spore coat polysaccharide biosynthesis protein SpsF
MLLDGQDSLLSVLLRRMARSKLTDDIVLATTTLSTDDAFSAPVAAHGARLFRGSETDLIARLSDAAADADVLVRVTGDNPLTDPIWIDHAVRHHVRSGGRLTTSRRVHADGRMDRSLPKGLSIDVLDVPFLRQIALNSTLTPDDREHVIPFFFRSAPTAVALLPTTPALSEADISLSVDTPADLRFVRQVVARARLPAHEISAETAVKLAQFLVGAREGS